MAYHNAVYLFAFLPASLICYQLTPRKFRWFTLLIFGYIFFYSFSRKLLVFLIGTSLLIYIAGLWLGRLNDEKGRRLKEAPKSEKGAIKADYRRKERMVLTGGIIVLLGVLGYLKYYNFFAENVNLFLAGADGKPVLQPKNLIMPIGISFYTLQAIGYMVDVYWGKIKAEKHFGRVALFLGFFPQIMEGPIARYSDTAETLYKCDSLRGENLSSGFIRIIWGLFKKMVIADRLAVLVNTIYDNYQDYSGAVIAVAAVGYTVQLYMEFSGCMDIVIGSGRMFGVILPENFRQPFVSKNPADFWRRWHITLGVWLKTYVFYPVATSSMVKKWNKFARKRFGKYTAQVGTFALTLFPVWICNGVWHGSDWNYIFYGMYYFVLLLAGEAVAPVREKVIKTLNADEDAWYWKIPRIGKTWIIIFVGELFFRANGLGAGMHMFFSMFDGFRISTLWDGTLLNMGMDRADFVAVIAGCIIVAVAGSIRERNGSLITWLNRNNIWVRWAIYYALIFAVIIFGAYGPGYQQMDLIYAEF